ncbi:acyl-CoA synthetase [Corynebacterium glutamicum]|uniref:acyl-CoA synthetase n=1 Tax=Corynebacterium glutamicum TaxID=1718 RepID=UPI00117E6583|nr:long-chain fatty acid--CoA ligase [Corynebacterium glutamicum]QDQ19895.1 long-chain fatty acid--CoA ligase [Corynebacterium glutamicum]QDQ23462.1 long-chain fatty acid--CoA ligase [Corynebacterium glutamicum]
MKVNLGIGSYPRRRATVRPESTAIEFEGTSITYGEFSKRVNRLGHALLDLGVAHQDRVAYVGFNHPALLEVFFSTNLIGATPVLVNPRLSANEIDYIIQDSGASIVFYGIDLIEHATYLQELHPEIIMVAVEGDEGPGLRRKALIEAASDADIDLEVSDDDIALLMYTSGTTGRPKGAMLSHRNLFFNYFNALLSQEIEQGAVLLSTAPLFHIAGLNMTTIPVMMKGGKVIIHREFRAEHVLDEIERSKVSESFMVPAMIDMLSNHPSFAERDLSSLRAIMVGGSPLSERALRIWQGRDVKIVQGFGMTETAPGACLLEATDTITHLGTAGRAHFFTDIKLVDPKTGEEVPTGEAGEVLIRGPHVMTGYWNRPEDTASALQNGWYHSGDIAIKDEDGYYTVKDRIKDMYISGGENIYPAEVEQALQELEAVLDAAVIGVPDERWGETGIAFVSLRESYLANPPTGPELRELLGSVLARYKLPREIHIIEELPRNATGKIQKNILRDFTIPVS